MATLTSWLDPLFAKLGGGLSTSDTSTRIGGEALGVIFEDVINAFAKGWLAKGAQFGLGLLSLLYGLYGKGDTRFKEELVTMGIHNALRVASMNPGEVLELRNSLEDMSLALKNNDIANLLRSGLRSTEELNLMLGGLMPSATPTAPAPPPVAPTAPAMATGSLTSTEEVPAESPSVFTESF